MIHPDTLSGMFTHRVRLAGLPVIRLHDVRHTFVSVALEAGEDIKVISERVGHAATAFTQDRYRHVMAGEQASSAERVAARLLG
jgi:integrase